MSKEIQKGAPEITPVEGPVWKASQAEVEVKAGEWVIFNSQGRPAWLWFPKAEQVVQIGPQNLTVGPVSIQTDPNLAYGTIIPYVFYLTHVDKTGEMLVGNSPPYIKIKDPTTPRGGTGGGDN